MFTVVIKREILILRGIEILQYFLLKKDMMSDSNMSHGKMSDFVSFLLFWVHFSHKTKKFWFLKASQSSIIFEKKMVSDSNMSHKNVWFWFISIIWIHFSHKTEILILKVVKKDVKFNYLSNSVWFGLRFVVEFLFFG